MDGSARAKAHINKCGNVMRIRLDGRVFAGDGER